MADSSKPKIFLSYASANEEIADVIDADFQEIGFRLTRDKRDLQYRENIEDFMKTVREHNFVLMLVSDEYLRSDNCMFEVKELMATKEYEKRALPVIYGNAQGIIKPEGQRIYFDYWKKREKEAIKSHKLLYYNKQSYDLLDRIKTIRESTIGEFLFELAKLKNYGLADLKQHNYLPLLDIIDKNHELSFWYKCQRTREIADFNKYLTYYPNGQFVKEANAAIHSIEAEEKLWLETDGSSDINKFIFFDNTYPRSKHSKAAKEQMRLIPSDNKPQKDEANRMENSQLKISTLYGKWLKQRLSIIVICILSIFIISVIVKIINKRTADFNNNQLVEAVKKAAIKRDSTAKADWSKMGNLKFPSGVQSEIIDDFKDNRNNWRLSDDPARRIFIENGALKIHGSLFRDSIDNSSLQHTNIDISKDFSCTVNVQFLSGDDNRGFGLVFDSDRLKDGYCKYYFLITENGNYLINYPKNNLKRQDLGKWTTSNDIYSYSTVNELSVKKKADSIFFYINRHLITAVPADNHGSDFGLRVSGEQLVAFSNFKLEGTGK